MFTRKVVTASAAAVALVALSVPVVNAQDDAAVADEAGSGSVSLGSLEGGSPDAGSLTGGSEGSSDDASGEDGTAGEEGPDTGSLGGGSLGSLDSASGEDTSAGDLVPETDEVCELPALGGSVAKFYPLLGIDGVPTGVLDLITSALDSFPNLLDVVAGEGRGSGLIGEAGSLSEGLCTLVLGGEMVPPPVTVIVDGDGAPISTTTGVAPAGTSSSATTATSGDVTGAGTPVAGSGEAVANDGGTGELALATSVPVPGA